MKANKFLAAAFAALALVGFASCGADDPQEKEADLALDQTSLTVKVGETATINATVAATWETTDATIATVAGADKVAVITGVAEGNAIIKATTKGGQTKTCVVKVEKASAPGPDPVAGGLKGSQQWPIVLDGDAYAANEATIVASFQPNDVDQFLYVWDATYEGANGDGLNSLGNSGYTALTVTTLGWAGMGYCLTANGNGWEAAKALNDAIVANPDQYALHLAIKSTDNFSHCFYFMGSEETKFVLGTNGVYSGPILSDFTRDGAWHEFDIEMSNYASALASAPVVAGVNVFVALTEGTQGAALNLDAVYFYKK